MPQACDQNSIPETAGPLARAYIDQLARAEGVSMQSMLKPKGPDDLSEFLTELEGGADDDAPSLRADMVAAAVLLARAVATEPGLATRLRRGDGPVVAIKTYSADLVDLVADVVTRCATSETSSKKLIITRDGSEKSPNKGTNEVERALHSRWPVIGIATDPKRLLPSALLKTAEYWLELPVLDEWAMRLILEALTGRVHNGPIDAELVRLADLSDLNISLRRDLSPEECLERLANAVKKRSVLHSDGPMLEDLFGYGDAKVWGTELVADLQDYRRGALAWADVDHKGLLLSGPPGTGKTSFAKALAKSAGVPLIATSVADWNASSYLSGTLQAIRRVFSEAARQAPSILFIDEIDGISSRSSLRGDYVEYWTQIVNLLLESLAGVEDRQGVVVVAATNHPQKIDPAIVRAGRLDRHIQLQKPDVTTLEKILRHHIGPEVLVGVELLPVALAASGGTGADVEAWVRRAKAAARRARRGIGVDDLLDQIRAGKAKMTGEARSRIAVHEAGHVVVGAALGLGKLIGVSINDGGGITELDQSFDGTSTATQLECHIALAMAGRAAEQLLLGAASIGSGNGADSDLARATQMAELLETQYGAGIYGPLHIGEALGGRLPLYPDLLKAVKERVENAQARSLALLADRLDVVKQVAVQLDKRGFLSPDEVQVILNGAAETPVAEAVE